jgi:hypothetical protein
MPNRCCFVPNCKAGYLGFKPCGKVVLFAPPKDEALFKQWEQNIPRNDANLKASSRVCLGHFEEVVIIKGRLLKRKEGKEIFFAWNNWSLKQGATTRIFPGFHFSFSNLIKLVSSFYINFSLYNIGCPSYLNKPKSAKRKLPKGRQTANKRNRTDCDQVDDQRE